MPPRNLDTVTHMPNRRAWLIGAVAAAFLVRIGVVLVLKTYEFSPLSPDPDGTRAHWEFGYEMGRVAHSIATGHGFGSPFHGWTGPTAWQPPIYPYLLAGIFRVFGVYSLTSGIVALAFNCAAAAATCLFIYKIAEQIAGTKFALWAAWMWALLPNLMEYDVGWAWETSLSALLLTIAIWWTMLLPEQRGLKAWLRLGALWGVIALTNTALLSIMPFALAWAYYRSCRRQLLYPIATLALMFAITMPWNVRDRIVLGKWMFVRDNFWAEMNYGNGEAAHGNAAMSWKHPGTQRAELQKYAAEGEVRYIDGQRREVLFFLQHNPRHFAKLIVVRMLLFWANIFKDTSDDLQPDTVLYTHGHILCFSALAWVGLALMLRAAPRHGTLLAFAMLLYPAIYYMTSVDGRYRHPIEPLMLILAVYAVVYASNRAAPSHRGQPAEAIPVSGPALV